MLFVRHVLLPLVRVGVPDWLEKAVFKKCDAARETLRGMDENPLNAQQMELVKLFSKFVGPTTIQEGYRDHLL